VWNVKRVRTGRLGPFDYTSEQYQPSLWWPRVEQYYGEVALYRAAVEDAPLFTEIWRLIQ